MDHPQAIFLQLTTRCNARCINCPHPSTYGKKEQGEMGDEVWGAILSSIVKNGYSGQVGMYLHGEPLLHNNIYTKIRAINRETRAHVVLSTNGSSLTNSTIDKLLEARPKLIHININSGVREQYEFMTGLLYDRCISGATRLIERARGFIDIEINCPVMPEVDTAKLRSLFPSVKVNDEYWANSRGGLLSVKVPSGKGSRFQIDSYCRQPDQNFNILYDGSCLVCCIDWAQESVSDFPSILEEDLFNIYNGALMNTIRSEFRGGDYSRYKMCLMCSEEMGFYRNEGSCCLPSVDKIS
jgi:pyruvate-formate lyase-activating enzyme